MKKLVLFKISKSIQLAHLYEHLFCAAIDRHFSSSKLYPYLDYFLEGTTYYGGVIILELDLRSKAAEKIAFAVHKLQPQLDDRNISIATMQLIAEKQVLFKFRDLDSVRRALNVLQASPWQDIDSAEIIDTKQIAKKPNVFTAVRDLKAPATTLQVAILLTKQASKSHRMLLSLFRQLARMITLDLQHKLPDTYGLFSSKADYRVVRQGEGLAATFSIAHGRSVDIAHICKTVFMQVDSMRRDGAFKRLVQELLKTNYYLGADKAPNLHKNYDDTFMIFGSQGWRSLATDENSNKLLAATIVRVKSGRRVVEHPLH